MATVESAQSQQAVKPPPEIIGPADHGRRMTLDEFIEAEGLDGYLYELENGVVVVTNVPGTPHGLIVRRVARAFDRYDEAHPGLIKYAAGGGECRLRFPGMQSDRHPDQAIYLTPIPHRHNPWSIWVPNLVVEVVSKRSRERDFVKKRAEYLAVGIDEYWIIDRFARKIHRLHRIGDQWDELVLGAGETLRTDLLPGLETNVGALLGEPDDRDDEPELEVV